LAPKRSLVLITCLILAVLGACHASLSLQSSPSPEIEEPLTLPPETANQLAVGSPITLVCDYLSWTILPTDILVNDWREERTIDEQKLETLLDTIATEVETTNPTPPLGPNDYLVNTGGSKLDKELARIALREAVNGGECRIILEVNQTPPQIEKLLRPAPPEGGTLYLTFDDAMLFGYEIMNIAERHGARVTFFPTGDTIVANPGVAAAAVQRGHTVQTHGYSHTAHAGKSLDWQTANIQQGVNTVLAATGTRPTLFRPPYGSNDANTYKAAAEVGVSVMLWNTSSIDTRAKTPEEVRLNVLRNARNGSVVLMHSWSQNSLKALPQILAAAQEQNYRVVALW
jgi:peptidoglycan/xylan/chitin deacetylase (PgdA/CDA1 family)